MATDNDGKKTVSLVRRNSIDYLVRKPDSNLIEGDTASGIRLAIRRFFGLNDNLEAAWDSYAAVLNAAARAQRALSEFEDLTEVLEEERELRRAAHRTKLALVLEIERTIAREKLDSGRIKELMDVIARLKSK